MCVHNVRTFISVQSQISSQVIILNLFPWQRLWYLRDRTRQNISRVTDVKIKSQ